jgi:CheY-like chemotaxis protein
MATIVVCEDDVMIQKLFRVVLSRTGHQFHIVPDGESGLTLIEQLRPNLVFTDVAMPGMSGIELVDTLKQSPELAAIPVVIVTASVQRAQIEEGYRHGVAGHLAKPFGAAELQSVVEHYLTADAVR